MERIIDFSNPIKNEQKSQAQAALARVLKRNDLGFHQLPRREELWQAAAARAEFLRARADDLVIVGIGGSSLGPKALSDIFEDPQNSKKLHFCDNVDAWEFDRLWKRLRDPQKTAWVFISKSGGTIETLVAADLILQKYGTQKPLVTVISEKKTNVLTTWAQEHQIPILEIPVDVGGRFSVLTAVGLLPMAFLGLSVAEFREGAEKALQDPHQVSDLIAHFHSSFQRQEWITFFWFYSSSFATMGRWLQQLWAESLAKSLDRQGRPAPRASTPMWGIGSSDQHSLLQQLMDGAKDKLIVFFRFRPIEEAGEVVRHSQFQGQEFFNGHNMGQLISAQAQGVRQALNEQKVSTLSLQIEEITPRSLGYQLMTWQLVVAGLGELMDINAFDQPGVELGKRLAKEILKS